MRVLLNLTLVVFEITACAGVAWLGPAIGPEAFEVGSEVRTAFIQHDTQAAQAFRAAREDKYLADIYLLARLRLQCLGVAAVSGGGFCTVAERARFFSYRRDGATGRDHGDLAGTRSAASPGNRS